jgi:cell division septum initiation protein DivIVA
MECNKGNKVPVPNKTRPDGTDVKKEFEKYRTKVDYNKAYLDTYIDPLIDTYDTLCGDILKMKNHIPIPEEAIAEAKEELAELKKIMVEAGFTFHDD